ncbi:AmmeMemoRadiSam system radical SAM enzyme [Propionibacterium freudenreichii]|uniref:AmmeMemoRadiSam system radical SAM enzyme n=1 Tax=Propionibacterium freudenreichii TaxID=1744 RepID=UPI001109F1F8|nr:AmmeMemoRadiSam system radical SAM enzyme [Propionibacterium freudenreichii]MDK9351299.1 AmmeMemoRadiSam system radical SAM enzyme [Propionibacterium freudenreichii]
MTTSPTRRDPAGTDRAGRASDGLPGRTARWWHALPDGRLRCELCPRECTLRDGQRGFCFARARHGDEIRLDTYGHCSGLAVDPIEKKPLNHVLPGSRVLSFGTAGCDLACRFCQNWEISTARSMTAVGVPAMPRDIAHDASARGCSAVAFTYNDPVVFAEYAMDAANIDLKGFTEGFYRRITGGRLDVVLDTIDAVVHNGRTWVELTTLLIPGMNDSDEELRAMCGWIVRQLGPDVPLHFTAFHPSNRMRDVPPTTATSVERARQIALDAGIHFVYTGNVHDPAGQTTWCPQCGTALIERDGYRVGPVRLDDLGRCRSCGYALPGIFRR